MYSLNVPVPRSVARLAVGLAAGCHTATVRSRHTLVVKRLGESDPASLGTRIREAIQGTAPFECRIGDVGIFDDPVNGPGPVVYLTVESPPLHALHERLCRPFDPLAELEGDAYEPHVTIARGGDARSLVDSRFEPRKWTVDRLVLWDGTYEEPIEEIALPP